ncbi:Transferrin [Eumeta japonica]|uniref:Transferrin n=1 Tax=Eumeta variegata TaxID=151549 RepID=A0A4C1YJR9_EUMVA|nr:Transferrin [Eumeta japonica]
MVVVSVVMITKLAFVVALIAATTATENFYRVCVISEKLKICQDLLERSGYGFYCVAVASNMECAFMLARDQVQIGVFSEEEMLFLTQVQTEGHRVVASIRDKENKVLNIKRERALGTDTYLKLISATEFPYRLMVCISVLAPSRIEFESFCQSILPNYGLTDQGDRKSIMTFSSTHLLITGRFAFETVAVVSTSHTGGLEGLRQGRYCHPGLGYFKHPWSPRVASSLEKKVAKTDRFSEPDRHVKTFEELEVSTLSNFFDAACRPGRWSSDEAVDTRLNARVTSNNATCRRTHDSNARVRVRNMLKHSYRRYDAWAIFIDNQHILALECLTKHNDTVAYVAWEYVIQYFLIAINTRRSNNTCQFLVLSQQWEPKLISNYALLCPDNTLVPLTHNIVNSSLSPCAWVQQPGAPWLPAREYMALCSRAILRSLAAIYKCAG